MDPSLATFFGLVVTPRAVRGTHGWTDEWTLPLIVRDRSLFMTGGGGRKRSQMSFYGKYFPGPLGTRRKHFAAHSTLRNNFSMPILTHENNGVL